MVSLNQGFGNPGARKKSGRQQRRSGVTNKNVMPICFCATLDKCQQGRRHFSIVTSAKKVKHATAGKIRRQLSGSVMWV